MRSNFGPCDASLAHNVRILESGKRVPLVSLARLADPMAQKNLVFYITQRDIGESTSTLVSKC